MGPQRARVPFFSTGTLVLLAIMIIGFSFGLARMITGLGPVTNLTNQYPWGIWIGIDVATGVALAAGGFTTAALVNIFGKEKYHHLERPALLTAWLGYLFVGIGLLFDLGKWYNIWHPAFHWQGNSVLFEVGMCVMFYLTVLTIEFAPTVLLGLCNYAEEGGSFGDFLKKFVHHLRSLRTLIRRVLPIFIIAGVVLSFMHQSSLGSLMLIAPTKLSSLWWTPILPILFLLSAIMVGFPMVIFESIIASKSFGRPSEMDLLTPLAGIVRWTLGLYAIVKLADVFIRNDLSIFLERPGDTTAWAVEVGVGIIIPFIMLLQKSVRRSPRLLFIAVSFIIGGVVLNRVNVFLVGFHPPFGDSGYFPAIGEIALTAGLIATIMFLYRFFAVYFPVLPAEDNIVLEYECRKKAKHLPRAVWVARGLAVLLIFSFIILYSLVHFDSIEETQAQFRMLEFDKDSFKSEARAKESDYEPPDSFSSDLMPSLLVIDREYLNKQVDDYAPVRFMHRAHAIRLKGRCNDCHHRVQEEEGDRVGVTLEFTHMDEHTPAPCSNCHLEANDEEHATRPGLKAAFHRQCMGCHERTNTDAAPVDCQGCHHRHVPNHDPHITCAGQPEPTKLTKRCLECHEQSGEDILHSTHWLWTGESPNTKGHEHETIHGKKTVLNGYCIHIAGSEERCSQCHIGYGWKDDSFDFENPNNIDCLICHDTTGHYKKNPKNAGMPMPGLNLVKMAKEVGRPDRDNCGICHFNGGGGANVKHGDLEPELSDPDESFDVHMGRHDMLCQDCHKTKNHRIAGQAMAIPSTEGRVYCEDCHGDKPHTLSGVLGFHLDKHVRSVACQTCHIPHVAKKTATKVFWDWSKAGKKQPSWAENAFNKKKGAFVFAENLVPTYDWYNGKHKRYLLGDKIDPDEPVVLNQPVGSYYDPTARIHPFKRYSSIVPMDEGRKILAAPKLWKGYWKHLDWKKALADGMKEVGMEFSGKVGFARADMNWALNHEVVPKSKALHCADCHDREAVDCTRCHTHEIYEAVTCKKCHYEEEIALDDCIKPIYAETKDTHFTFHDVSACQEESPNDVGKCLKERLEKQNEAEEPPKRFDFEALGYEGDPAMSGGRLHHSTSQ